MDGRSPRWDRDRSKHYHYKLMVDRYLPGRGLRRRQEWLRLQSVRKKLPPHPAVNLILLLALITFLFVCSIPFLILLREIF